MLLVSTFAWGQQISKEEMLFLTPLWKGERFADGRPKASDALLQRLKSVTLEEAWAVLKNENFKQLGIKKDDHFNKLFDCKGICL